MKKKLLFLVVLLCSMAATVTTSYAQDKEFWFPLVYWDNFARYKGNGGFVISNPSLVQTATVQIHTYQDGVREASITIPPGGYYQRIYTQAEYEAKFIFTRHTTGVHAGGTHIKSNIPIFAYHIYDFAALQETYLLKGSAGLGTMFTVPFSIKGSITFPGGYSMGGASSPFLSIMATDTTTTTNVTVNTPGGGGPYLYTMNGGECVELMPGTLAGATISSDRPIAVNGGYASFLTTHTYDEAGDQLVADSYAGNTYVWVLSSGYLDAPINSYIGVRDLVCNFLDITALENGTNVYIQWESDPAPVLLGTLNAGQSYLTDTARVNRRDNRGCATITSDKPIHVVQMAGKEGTACMLPNFYATNTHQTSFFTYWEEENPLFKPVYAGASLVYRAESEDDFTISYPGQPETDLFTWIAANALYIDGRGDVPSFPGWKYIRFSLPPAATNQIVTVKCLTAVFQLGFSSEFCEGTSLTYFSSFNNKFSFDPDSVYTCPGQYTTLIGGIASWYKWTLPDGSIKEGANLNSLKARDMGMYILDMTQGIGSSNHVIDTCWVFSTSFSDGTPGGITKSIQKPFKVGKPQSLTPTINSAALDRMTEIRWTIEGATYVGGTNETTPAPYVQFNSTGVKNGTLYMKYETVYPDKTRAVCDSTINFRLVVQPETVVYVATPGTPNKVGVNDDEKSDDELFNEGKGWDDPFNLEDALKQAYAGDYILVPAGTYTPKKDNSFIIDGDNVTLIGGAKGWETSPEEVILDPTNCIIQGNGNSAVIFDNAASLAHSGSCLSHGTTLQGFTIQGGEAVNGGGILFSGGASGTIAHCIVKNNTAKENGGGIYTVHSTCDPVDPILYNVEISANRAKLGAGMYNDASKPQLTNVTIGGNAASVSGSGMYNAAASPAIRNTIVYGNITKEIALEDEFVNDGGMPAISYSIIRGSNGSGTNWNTAFGADGGHNVDKSPSYRRSGFTPVNDVKSTMQAGNYRIVPQSPAYNHGYNVYVKDIPMDLDGNDRINDDVVDMGAYEYWPDSITGTRHDVVINTYDHVTTVPPAGIHYVDGQADYMVTFYPKDGYSLQYMTVTTGSDWQDNQGGMIKTVNPDGSVTVIFQKVSQPLDIKIGGVAPTANEAIESITTMWASGGNLYVQVAKASQLNIYTVTGQLYRQQTVGAGETAIPLAQGVYVVTLDNGTKQKIVIK